MKIQDLPPRYLKLFEKRCGRLNVDELIRRENISNRTMIGQAFFWDGTPEGTKFWFAVEQALNISQLPPIPIEFRKTVIKHNNV